MYTLLKLSLVALIALCPSVANAKPNWVEIAVTEDGDDNRFANCPPIAAGAGIASL